MTDDGFAVVLKMQIPWLDTRVTKFFCSKCKMELTDPSDHTKFKANQHWRGGHRILECPQCHAQLREVVTPLINPDTVERQTTL